VQGDTPPFVGAGLLYFPALAGWAYIMCAPADVFDPPTGTWPNADRSGR
jgi:hypothetical protein